MFLVSPSYLNLYLLPPQFGHPLFNSLPPIGRNVFLAILAKASLEFQSAFHRFHLKRVPLCADSNSPFFPSRFAPVKDAPEYPKALIQLN